MNTYLIANSTSGISEGMEGAVSTNFQSFIGVLIAGLVIFSTILFSHLMEEHTDFLYGSSLILGLFLFGIVLGVPGFLIFSHIADNSREDLDTAVVQNIGENFDLQDLSVEVVDGYDKEHHQVAVSGTQHGQFIEFEAAYSAEHDLMMPVETDVDIIAKEGSELEALMNE